MVSGCSTFSGTGLGQTTSDSTPPEDFIDWWWKWILGIPGSEPNRTPALESTTELKPETTNVPTTEPFTNY